MIRRLLALSLILAVSGVTPAHAEVIVDTVSVTRPTGPNPHALVGAADGKYLFGDGRLYNAAGLVDVVEELAVAAGPSIVWEFDGDSVALTRGIGSAREAVRVDLVTGQVDVAQIDTYVRGVGLLGWVSGSTFHTWDGASTALPFIADSVAQAHGHLVHWTSSDLGVFNLTTQESRSFGRASTFMALNRNGFVFLPSAGGRCLWDWGPGEPVCASIGWRNSSGSFVGHQTVLQGTVRESPRRYEDFKVWWADAWLPAPSPSGKIVTACAAFTSDVLCSVSGQAGRSIMSVTPEGEWETVLELPHEPVTITSLALTPTALVGNDDRAVSTTGGGSWRRSTIDGPEVRLGMSGTVWSTGQRTLVGGTWFDGMTRGPVAPVPLGDDNRASGTVVISRRDGVVVDHLTRIGTASQWELRDVFGTNILRGHILETGQLPPWSNSDGKRFPERTWGPWVAGVVHSVGGFVDNWRNGTNGSWDIKTHGNLWGLGDGIMVTRHETTGALSVFDITRLNGGQISPAAVFSGFPRSIDRNRLAWTTPQGDIRVSTFTFGGTTPPALLGRTGEGINRSASAPWTPGFDFSAPVAPGSITIRDAAGGVVRTLPTAASSDGSIRPVWDLRDTSGRTVPNGGYTWELAVADPAGRPATKADLASPIKGHLTVGPTINLVAPTPAYVIPCGRVEETVTTPSVLGLSWSYRIRPAADGRPAAALITAKAIAGYAIVGTSYWEVPLTKQACDGIVAPPTFHDPSGSQSDRLVIPWAKSPVTDYWVNGGRYLGGSYLVVPGSTVVVEARFSDQRVAPLTWRHTYSAAGAEDVYSVPGEHLVNGRRWQTVCEPYSVTTRCTTQIWATKTVQVGDRFVSTNGWVFNNLTYLPSPRASWSGNPLASNKQWTAADGRLWRTECDTARTGRGGCRSEVRSMLVVAEPTVAGGYTFSWQWRWVVNNIVRFS